MNRILLPRTLPILLAALAAANCGKRGDPMPPFPHAPAAIHGLATEQEGDEILLTFGLPDRLLTGEPLTDLAAVEVWRVTGAADSIAQPPPAPPPGGTAADRLPGYTGRRQATDLRLWQQQFYEQAKLAGRLEGEAMASATHGAIVVFRDPLAGLLAGAGPPPRLAYAAVAVRGSGERSPLSNIAVVSPEVPPGAPEALSAMPEEGKVRLQWAPPAKDLLGGEAKAGGYFVYRRLLPEARYGPPLNPTPIAETSFSDEAPPYGQIAYTVRAVLPEKTKIEGPAAPDVVIDYRDVYPPAAPARVDALPESGGVRLVWDPSPSSDLAGYIVERAPEGGAFARLTSSPIAETVYVDKTATPGTRHRYAVRAVDKAGNVSGPSPEAIAQPM